MPALTIDDLRVAEIHTRYIDRLIHKNHYLSTIPPGAKHRYVISGGLQWGIVGGAMWGRPVARMEDQEKTLELTRFWTADYTPKNTESWALGRMIKDLKSKGTYDRLIAYSSEGHHEGTIYKATNWTDLGARTTGCWENRDGRTTADPSDKRKWEYLI